MPIGSYGVTNPSPGYPSTVRGRSLIVTVVTALAAVLLVISLIRELWLISFGMACLLVAQLLAGRERIRRSHLPSADTPSSSD